jgi:cephalosporin-C deacetylase-like acetyl esterase
MRHLLPRLFVGLFATLFCAGSIFAGPVSVEWSTDKEPLSYKSGDKVTFNVKLLQDGKVFSGKNLKWKRTGDDGKTESGEAVSSAGQSLKITTSAEQPGFVRVEIAVLNADGSPIKDDKGKPLKFEGGVGIEPEKLTSVPEPADFDAFWQKQKEALAKVPMVAKLTEVPSKNPAFTVYDVKVDCAGGKPVSGYLTIPKNAKEKSLPARVTFRGYGVDPANPDFRPESITFQINAHGFDNGRDPKYYADLKSGELSNYALKANENAKPETSYFTGMMLRAMRAMEYIKSRPEWNGKTLIVSGGSQGGLQCITAAALDADVTRCEPYKPWCCDLEGIQLKRLNSIFRPAPAAALGYFDSVNHAKRIKCETFITAGLGDYVCPPSGVTVLYNNIKAPKTIKYFQGTTHGYDQPNPKIQTVSNK